MYLHALPVEQEEIECTECHAKMTLEGDLLECDKCDHKVWPDGSEYEGEE